MSIPKLVHQIWIGPKKRPDIWMDSVRNFCLEKGYEYVLWDDQKVSEMNMVNREWYDKEETYNGKSDILRYEILYQNGGIYIDADSFIIKFDQLDKIISEFNRDAGFGFEIDNKLACGGVSLAKKESLFMKKCIDEIPKRDFNLLAWQSIGPQLITDLSIKYQKEIPLVFYKSTIFYPRRWHGIQDIKMHEKMELPPESVMFQYGYSTNNLESKI
jgi:mannosyltransferase OCH1-like enzyme